MVEIDHYCTDKPVCPWCGHEQDPVDIEHHGSGATWDCELDDCRKPIVVTVECTPSFWTRKGEIRDGQ